MTFSEVLKPLLTEHLQVTNRADLNSSAALHKNEPAINTGQVGLKWGSFSQKPSIRPFLPGFTSSLECVRVCGCLPATVGQSDIWCAHDFQLCHFYFPTISVYPR
jgi:hypothetical protein